MGVRYLCIRGVRDAGARFVERGITGLVAS